MFSFYGGEAGQSFSISKIFSNKVELDKDLDSKWTSEIMPGEYVLISYGAYIEDIVDIEGNILEKKGYDSNLEIDQNTYGKSANYNATLWKKSYWEESLTDVKDREISFGTNKIDGQREGLCYELISVLTGNTPKLELSTDTQTQVLGPSENPIIKLDTSDINRPKLSFELPRAVRFFNGLEVDLSPEQYDEISRDPIPESKVKIPATANLAQNQIKKGDYYINKKNSYIFLYQEDEFDSEGNLLNQVFVYQGDLQPKESTKGVTVSPVDSFIKTQEGTDLNPPVYEQRKPNIKILKEQGEWGVEVEAPQLPKIVEEIEYVGSGENIENNKVLGKITKEDEITYNLKLPRGARIFSGVLINGEEHKEEPALEAKLGDIYLNTDQDNDSLGNVYRLEIKESGQEKIKVWKNYGSIKGPMGEGIKVVRSFVIDKNTTFQHNLEEIKVGQDTLENVSKFLDANVQELRADEVVAVTYRAEMGGTPETQAVQQAISLHDSDEHAHSIKNWISVKDSDAVTYQQAKISPIKLQSKAVSASTEPIPEEKFHYDVSYWYFQIEKEVQGENGQITKIKVWNRICITSGLYGITYDEYIDNGDKGKIYSTNYINNLISNNDGEQNEIEMARTTYNKTVINKKIDGVRIQWHLF